MSATQTDPLLQVRDISLSFRGVHAITALTFSILRGEICSLIGPNGAGKSSLLNLINGVYWPDAGQIVFEGRVFGRLRAHQAAQLGIARTFQNNALFKRLSVLDNVLTGLSRHGHADVFAQVFRLPAARAEERHFLERAEEVMEFLHIDAYRYTVVGQLPYGLQKRVELGPSAGFPAGFSVAGRTHGRNEPGGEGRHVTLHRRHKPLSWGNGPTD
jgi:branched-chain amino acid transport system ATP-binding protein